MWLWKFLNLLSLKIVGAGEVLIRQGKPLPGFLIVLDGTLTCLQTNIEGGTTMLGQLEEVFNMCLIINLC